MKYIDSEKLIAEIDRRIAILNKELKPAAEEDFVSSWASTANNKRVTLQSILSFITFLQQEQPIKVYRVENEKEQKGLWRKFDGTWEPLFDMLTDGQCKDMPMEDSSIYREGGKQWFASAPSKETLQKWFSKRDLEELTAKGFTISEFEVVGHKKISDFEYIFTRDSIISRTYLKVSDIYPQEQPMPDSTKLIEFWNEDKEMLKEKDFRDDAWRLAYNAFLCGFGRGISVKKEQPDEDIEEQNDGECPICGCALDTAGCCSCCGYGRR